MNLNVTSRNLYLTKCWEKLVISRQEKTYSCKFENWKVKHTMTWALQKRKVASVWSIITCSFLLEVYCCKLWSSFCWYKRARNFFKHLSLFMCCDRSVWLSTAMPIKKERGTDVLDDSNYRPQTCHHHNRQLPPCFTINWTQLFMLYPKQVSLRGEKIKHAQASK